MGTEIVFTDCDFTAARSAAISASASASSGGGGGAARHAHAHRRWEVVVAGKRVKTVDVHAHCIVPDAAKVINHPLEAPGLLWDNVGTRLAEMDRSGVDVEALSINPYWYRAERDAAAELIRINNEALAEFCAGHPDRFVAFATAALQYPDLAAQQVEHAVKNLGFRGVGVAGSVAGEDLANPKFHPFWAKCEELGVLVFMHPLGTRELEPSRPPRRQRPPDQHDRQSAGNHDRAVAPDFRGDARPLSRASRSAPRMAAVSCPPTPTARTRCSRSSRTGSAHRRS